MKAYRIYSPFLFLIATLSPLISFCQFTGSNNDGFSSILVSKTTITDAIAFRGSISDGFANYSLPKTAITDAAAFTGGSSDGFHYILLSKTTITDAIAFVGGIGRGETQGGFSSCTGETVIWNGSINTDWANAGNWNCSTLPNINSTVIIPFGVPNYPQVNADFEIKKLMLNANASMIILPGVKFKINGL